jgi:hypothetical protein
MSYLIERTRALWSRDVVAVLAFRRGKTRSRLVLRDNSLYHTLTRPRTLARMARAARSGGARGMTSRQGAIWWKPR